MCDKLQNFTLHASAPIQCYMNLQHRAGTILLLLYKCLCMFGCNRACYKNIYESRQKRAQIRTSSQATLFVKQFLEYLLYWADEKATQFY